MQWGRVHRLSRHSIQLKALRRRQALTQIEPSFRQLHLHYTYRRATTMAGGFQQAKHPLLVIPGPIEVTNDVLVANANPSLSHMGKPFTETLGTCIKLIRKVLLTKNGQPFIVAGSGTLGWDMVAANLAEPGDDVLVLHSGYFGDSFAECFETYGAKPTQLKAPIGDSPDIEKVKQALKERKYKLLTFTHVDTSTGVRSDAKAIVDAVKEVSPETLVVLDGVCSVGSEEIRMDEWGIDVVMCASQKGLGVPPGLCIVCASERAIKTLESRKSRVTSYFGSWKKWLPVMKGYEEGKPSYFATPPIQIITALRASLEDITRHSMESRWEAHYKASLKIKKALVDDLGLKQLPSRMDLAANGMTALYFPDGLGAPDVVPKLLEKGVVVAGGLHKEIAAKYFRIGHMGVTVTDPSRGDLDKVIEAVSTVFKEAGHQK